MVKYNTFIDTIIVTFVVEDQDINAGGAIIFYSFTDIYSFVREIYPTVGKDTIQRHLNRMVEEQILVRIPKEYSKSYKNRTLYIVTPEGRKFWEQFVTPDRRKFVEEAKRQQNQEERRRWEERQRQQQRQTD